MLIHLLIQNGARVQTFEATRIGDQPVLMVNPPGAQLRLSIDGVPQSGRGLSGKRRGADLVVARDGEDLLVLQSYFDEPSALQGDAWGLSGEWPSGANVASADATQGAASDSVAVTANTATGSNATSTYAPAAFAAGTTPAHSTPAHSTPANPTTANPTTANSAAATPPPSTVWAWPALGGLGLLGAAAGGGGGAVAAAVAAAVTAPAAGLLSISGQVVAGTFFQGVEVRAYDNRGVLLGSAEMNGDGSYQLQLRTDYRGVLLLIARDTNGDSPNFTSEAGTPASLSGEGVALGHLRALVPVASGREVALEVTITPVTEMAVAQWQRFMADDDAPAVVQDFPTATELQSLHAALAELLGLRAPEGAASAPLPSWPVEVLGAALLQTLAPADSTDPEETPTTTLSAAQTYGWVLAQLAGLDAAQGRLPSATVAALLDALQDPRATTGLTDTLPAAVIQQLNQGAAEVLVFWARNPDASEAAQAAAQSLLNTALQAYAQGDASAAVPSLGLYAAAGMDVTGLLAEDAALLNAALRGRAGDTLDAVKDRAVDQACELISSYQGDTAAKPTASHYRLATWADSTTNQGPTVAADHLSLLNDAVAFTNRSGAQATPVNRVDSADELTRLLQTVQGVFLEAGDSAGNHRNPTAEDYAALGVDLGAFGANPTEGLLRFNALLRAAGSAQADALEELQALMAQVVTEAQQIVTAYIGSALSNTGASSVTTPTLADHQLAGYAEQTADGQTTIYVSPRELMLVNAALALVTPSTPSAPVADLVRAASGHALAVLREARDNSGANPDPTLDNYAALGVDLSAFSANPVEGLARMNTLVRQRGFGLVDTPQELQALVAQVVTEAQQTVAVYIGSALSNTGGTPVTTPTLADHQLAGYAAPATGEGGSLGVTAQNLALVNAALSVAASAPAPVDVPALVRAASAHAQAVLQEASDSAGTHPDPTAANYTAFGVSLSAFSANTAEGVLRLNALLRSRSAAQADSVEELQALVAQVVQQASDVIDQYSGTNTAPTLADYHLAGATAVTANRIAWVNQAAARINQDGGNPLSFVASLLAAAGRIVGEVGDTTGTNPNPTYADYTWFGLPGNVILGNQAAAAELVSSALRQRAASASFGPQDLSTIFSNLQSEALAALAAYQSDAAAPTGFPTRSIYDLAGVVLPAYEDAPGLLRSWNSTLEAQLGSALARLGAEATDTLPEVQAVVDAYCRVLDYLSGFASTAPTAADYLAIGVDPSGPMAPMLAFSDVLAYFHQQAIGSPGRVRQLEQIAAELRLAALDRVNWYGGGGATLTLVEVRLAFPDVLTNDPPRFAAFVELLMAALPNRPRGALADTQRMVYEASRVVMEIGDASNTNPDPTRSSYFTLGLDTSTWGSSAVGQINAYLRGLAGNSPMPTFAELQAQVISVTPASRLEAFVKLAQTTSLQASLDAFTQDQFTDLAGLSAAPYTDENWHWWLDWARRAAVAVRREQPGADLSQLEIWELQMSAVSDDLHALWLEIGDRNNQHSAEVDWQSLGGSGDSSVWLTSSALYSLYPGFANEASRFLNFHSTDYWANHGLDTLGDTLLAMSRLLVDGLGAGYFGSLFDGIPIPGSTGLGSFLPAADIAAMTLSVRDMALLLGMELPDASNADGQQAQASLSVQAQWLEVAMAEWRLGDSAPSGVADWTTVALNALWGSAAVMGEVGDTSSLHTDPLADDLLALGLDLSAWGSDTQPELNHLLESLRQWGEPALPSWADLENLVADSAAHVNAAHWLSAAQPPQGVLGA